MTRLRHFYAKFKSLQDRVAVQYTISHTFEFAQKDYITIEIHFLHFTAFQFHCSQFPYHEKEQVYSRLKPSKAYAAKPLLVCRMLHDIFLPILHRKCSTHICSEGFWLGMCKKKKNYSDSGILNNIGIPDIPRYWN